MKNVHNVFYKIIKKNVKRFFLNKRIVSQLNVNYFNKEVAKHFLIFIRFSKFVQ
jgi:hypothetical protein